jgi:hypothetical protein
MSKPFKSIAFYMKKALFWIFVENESKNAKVKPDINESKSARKAVTLNANQTSFLDIPPKECLSKCNCSCKCCCFEKLSHQKRLRKIKNAQFDSNVSALNYFAFFVLLLVIFGCNTAIWRAILN